MVKIKSHENFVTMQFMHEFRCDFQRMENPLNFISTCAKYLRIRRRAKSSAVVWKRKGSRERENSEREERLKRKEIIEF